MKLFFCQSLETSDDEEEEAGEEEQSEESAEDDDGKYGVDSEEDMPSDGVDENGSGDKLVSGSSSKAKIEKNNVVDSIGSLKVKPNKADESENDSDASVSTDADISLRSVTGKLDIKGGVEGVQVKKPNSNAPTLSSETKPARSTTEMMVVEAIRNLNERGGSSVLAINKYIKSIYPQLDGPRTLRLIKQYIKKAVTNGRLVQAKGSGLTGSFKISAEINRLEQRQKRKKLMQKAKKDAPAKKAVKKPKTIKKKAENGEPKPATVENTTKPTKATKAAKPVVKLDNAAEPTAKLPKVSATAKKMAKATDSKNSNKTATKDVKPSTIANNQPLEKPKVATQSKSAKGIPTIPMNSTADKEVKGSHTKSASAPPIPAVSTSSPKAMSKGKAAAMPKKKPLAKGKTSAAEVAENGAGGADTVKPAKKLAGKKTKTK
ncbi:histone H1-III-like [Anastrepha ludens]|uniref:histone H1-III-like n=1 Tax=Anastrepha ludens TaxID=28586 RepID=UPI0023AFEB83|nr:histone H1-III-like [Anastrepha ludens]